VGAGPVAELVDVVDQDDRIVGIASRSGIRGANLCHRAVAVVVVRGDGAVLAHRRSAAKALWPDRWDVAAGGAVDHGETYDEGAARELAEELGVRGVPLEPIGTGRYRDRDVDEHLRVYRVRHEGPFSFCDGEVVETCWVAETDLAGWVGSHRLVPDSAAVVLALLSGPGGALA